MPCQTLDAGSYKATQKMMAEGTITARAYSMPVVTRASTQQASGCPRALDSNTHIWLQN